jgi:hypothetical protein
MALTMPEDVLIRTWAEIRENYELSKLFTVEGGYHPLTPRQRIKYIMASGRYNDSDLAVVPGRDLRSLSSQLLVVSRQIHAEATPILYGMNTFDVGRDQIQVFVDHVGPRSRYLRKIKIYLPILTNQAKTLAAVVALDPATNLQSLEFWQDDGPPPQSWPRGMAKRMLGWTNRQIKARALDTGEEELSVSDAASIIRFGGCSSMDSYSAEVKVELEKLLLSARARREARKQEKLKLKAASNQRSAST